MNKAVHKNALKPGHKINWYRITDVLGVGGFGITYLAYDENLAQDVAIKEYFPREYAVRVDGSSVEPASGEHGEDFRWGLDRFISEGRIIARYDHPAIVRVLSVFEANNTAYLVMRYERGATLKEVLKHADEVDEDDLKMLLRSLLDGLERMHESGVIHRDIKPDNIFVRSDGSPLLLDFGSARQAMGEKTMDLTAVVSAGYAPIEQYAQDEGKQGPWTDIYGLGATIYRAMAGSPPPDALVRSNSLINLHQDAFDAVTEAYLGKYSYAFLRAIDHALAFKPNDRPHSIAEWRDELRLDERRDEEEGKNRSFVAPSGQMAVDVAKVDTDQWEIEDLKKEADSEIGEDRTSIEDDFEHVIGKSRRDYYLERFTRISRRGGGLRFSWNWAAALLTWCWLMYRKMYLWAFVFYPLVAAVLWAAVLFARSHVLGPEVRLPLAGLEGYLLLSTLLGGIYGNAVYRAHALRKIRAARGLALDHNTRVDALARKGGTNPILPVLAGVAVTGLVAGIGLGLF